MIEPHLDPVKKLLAPLTLFALLCFVSTATAQNSNTIVRFHFYRGATVVGDVDVELFNQDKPVTVSNFLKYAEGGFFKNLWIYRCLPRFVIQAGGYWIPTPQSAAQYRQDFVAFSPNFGSITNEFSVGPRLGNTFGTLAMARVGGETNSASSEWFLNLGDNSGLDNVDGGFTVFGRIVGATNALDFFNHPSPKLQLLGEVPASVLTRTPHFNELYYVDVSVLPIATNKLPVVTITSPVQNLTTTHGTILVTGTASGAQPVTTLLYSIGSQGLTNVPGSASWSIPMEAQPGTNLITVSGLDSEGQRSVAATRSIFHSVPAPLSLMTNGNGTILGATNGQQFEIQRSVTLTAKPAPGHLFVGWTGTYVWTPAKITFPMASNTHLTATCVTNAFPAMKGTYSGLFYNPNYTYQPGGAITFSVTDQGKVSGKLNMAGRNLPFSGALSPYGEADIPVSVQPLFGVRSNWFVVFTLDVTNRSDQVFGPVGSRIPYVWNPSLDTGFASELKANRVRVGTAASPSSYAGKYTLAIPGSSNVFQLSMGSFGSVSNFSVKLSAHLDPLSQYLWDQFSVETQAGLTNTESTVLELQTNLVAALNPVLEGSSIYDASRFAGITLSAETLVLKASNPTGNDRIRLNRLLLRDAYPQFIASPLPLRPEGDSYGAVTISASGAAKVVGSLADGTPFTASAPITTNGMWPLYTGLYGVRGWLSGWVQYDSSNPVDDLHGSMRWRKLGPFPGKPYGDGFEVLPSLAGSRYATATSVARVLNFTNGVVALNGPSLPAASTNRVFFATNNTVRNLDTNKLAFIVVKPSGLFSGKLTPVGETRSISLKGTLLPKQNLGTGYYLSTNQSGRVYFGE